MVKSPSLRRLEEVERALFTWVEGQPPALSWLVPELARLLDSEQSMACSYAPNENGLYLPWAHVAGVRPDIAQVVNEWLAGRGENFTAFNPFHPPPEQRNVIFTFGELRKTLGIQLETLPIWSLYEVVGIAQLEQMRVLACDQSLLMGYVSVMQEEPFTAEQRDLFARVTPSLVRRLKAESTLDAMESHGALLEAALAQIPAAAFVLEPSGRVVETNRSGHTWLDQHGSAGRVLLVAALRQGGTKQFQVIEVAAAGCAKRYLVVGKADVKSLHSAELAARAWGLTARETQVLRLLEDGLSNRALAAHLGVALRTIEAHLTSMFEKAQVESRSELIARALRYEHGRG